MARASRPVRTDGHVAFVPLTKGRFATIDAGDAWLVERWSWFALVTASGAYAGRSTTLNGRKYTILLHRHLVSAPPGLDVDHRDGDGLNCRRRNLRLCTTAQNAQNRGASRRNALGVRGVFFNGTSYVATIGRRYLGSFDTLEAARAAYADAARAAYGEFAPTRE